MGEGAFFPKMGKIAQKFMGRVGRGYASCSLALKIKSQIKKKGILENYLSKY